MVHEVLNANLVSGLDSMQHMLPIASRDTEAASPMRTAEFATRKGRKVRLMPEYTRIL